MNKGGLTSLLLAVSFLCIPSCVAITQHAGAPVEPIVVGTSPIANKPVKNWSVHDVEYWMNHTVGYAEFSGYVRKYLVDGPTLLGMEPADFEEHFPVENAIQVVKLISHVKLLKGLCLCDTEEEAVVDFWSYFRKENFRVWVVGGTAVFFPRLAMLYTFFLDSELYTLLLGVPTPQASALSAAAQGALNVATRTVSFSRTLLYILSFAVAPELFLAYEAAYLSLTNYFIMPVFVVHFIIQAFNSYTFLLFCWGGNAFPPNTSYLKVVWDLCSYTMLVPPALLLLYPVLPYVVQSLVVYLLLGYIVLGAIGFCALFTDVRKSAQNSS
ncbi:hypothetical protein TraAM80_07500 [Trypanosoma rangeli]|uniref:SAM domain-containing protein n=1 Tax=Trypanosoma rangeli TaxID=5698 RepID=A0A3R7N5J4_TRYRA|nr:uncharacterized protein TraAM80_07500 [Trypanosoma rangeli]RNF00567.1 hypothetical protein TraAM80_07500 [Trypanosoma rangeli]|eukprot:RNF00567.1 hypothetical protein TraAM80_07500 [Trypanosoma rangeli]